MAQEEHVLFPACLVKDFGPTNGVLLYGEREQDGTRAHFVRYFPLVLG